MNFNPYFSPKTKKIIIFISLVMTIFMGLLTYYNWPHPACTSVATIDTSIGIKSNDLFYLGFNLDKDSLKFGMVSPAATATRAILVNNTKDAEVTVSVQGDFSSWMNTIPQQFNLKAYHPQRVEFQAVVPENTPNGNYTGKIFFCFKER